MRRLSNTQTLGIELGEVGQMGTGKPSREAQLGQGLDLRNQRGPAC